ncbi:MAG: hypothetical protein ACJ72N_26820 [Labedaea sp.]
MLLHEHFDKWAEYERSGQLLRMSLEQNFGRVRSRLDELGETLALTGTDVQLHTGSETGKRDVAVHINAHLVEDSGKDIRRVPGRKSKRASILVPNWSEPTWLRRKAAAGTGPLFPSVGGGWLDQANCDKRLRVALDGAGFEWVTARVWRKTVGTLMRRAGRGSEDIAEQLGNTRAVAEKHYIAPPTMTHTGAEALLKMIKPRRSAEGFRTGKVPAEPKKGSSRSPQKGRATCGNGGRSRT